MINYKNFKIDSDNLRQLAPMLLAELENKIGFEEVIVITKDLSGNEKKQRITVEMARAGLNNPKMTDLVIASTEMRFEWPDLAQELFDGIKD